MKNDQNIVVFNNVLVMHMNVNILSVEHNSIRYVIISSSIYIILLTW